MTFACSARYRFRRVAGYQGCIRSTSCTPAREYHTPRPSVLERLVLAHQVAAAAQSGRSSPSRRNVGPNPGTKKNY